MKKIKTESAMAVYNALAAAKLTKMDDADKYRVIKAMRELKGIATAFEDFREDAQKKLQGEEHEEMIAKAQQWQAEGDKTTLTEEERMAVNKYLTDYNRRVAECVSEEAAKESELAFELLTQDAFGKLMASNDWTVGQIMLIEDALV